MDALMLGFGRDNIPALAVSLERFGICVSYAGENIPYNEPTKKTYDIVIINSDERENTAELLRRIRDEKLYRYTVLYSDNADFNTARSGIVYDAFDYIIGTDDESRLNAMLLRMAENGGNVKRGKRCVEEMLRLFRNRDAGIYGYAEFATDSIYSDTADKTKADKIMAELYMRLASRVFKENEWLKLYFPQNEINTYGGCRAYCSAIVLLFDEYCALMPAVTNDKLREMILYILNNPEDDLRQKTIAEKLYMNPTYLSTLFAAQAEMRFVDYLTLVRLKRAAYLLKQTSMRIVDIAERLDYKDIGYFSRIFKKHYGMTPSDYRVPDNYNYQI